MNGHSTVQSVQNVRTDRLYIFPVQNRGRPTKITFDDAYEDILRVVRTGMQWRQLQPKTVSFITVFKTMHRWVEADVFRTAYQRLLRLYQRRKSTRYYCIDSTFVKNIYGMNCTGRNPTDPRQTSDQAVYGCRQQRCVARHASDARKPFRHASLRADAGQSSCAARTRKRNVRRQGVRLKRQPTHLHLVRLA